MSKVSTGAFRPTTTATEFGNVTRAKRPTTAAKPNVGLAIHRRVRSALETRAAPTSQRMKFFRSQGVAYRSQKMAGDHKHERQYFLISFGTGLVFIRSLTMTETTLALVHASTLSEGDYNVYDGERIIGQIKLYPQSDRPWFWIITASERVPTLSDLGYAASREQVLADFKSRWKIK